MSAKRGADRTTRLLAVTAELARAITLDEVARIAVEEGTSALDARDGGMWTMGEDGRAHLLRSTNYPPEMARLFDVVEPSDATPLGDAIARGTPIFVENRAQYASRYAASEARSGAAASSTEIAFACIPLVVQSKVVGAMSLSFDDRRALDEEERAFLLVLGAHCAQAIERTRLFRTEHEARVRAEKLQALSAGLARAVAADDVARAAIEEGRRALDARNGGLFVLDAASNEAVLVADAGFHDEGRRAFARFSLDADLPMAVAIRERRALWFASSEDYRAAFPAAEASTASYAADVAFACLPLMVENEVIGGMTFVFHGPRPFGAEERSFLLSLATICAQTFDRARLFEAERRAREQIVRLHTVTAALSEAMTTHDVCRIVVDHAVETLGASLGGVWMESADRRHIEAPYLNAPESAHAYRRMPADAPIPIAEAIRTHTPIVVASLDEHAARYPRVHEILSRGGITSWATVALPLRVRDRRAGLLMSFADGRSIRADERALLDALADQCSLALERARLFDEQLRSNERLQLLADASASLASTLDYDATLKNVVALVVPRLADFAFFDVVEANGVRRTARAADPEKQAILDASTWVKSDRTDVNLCALSNGTPGFHAVIDDAFLRDMASGPEHHAVLKKLQLCAMITVPLHVRGELVASLTLCMGESGRSYDEKDLEAALDLARRAAMGLDNARLFREVRDAVRVRDDFLSIASHELRTPITSMKIHLYAMRRRGLVPDNVGQRVESVERQVDRLAQLVARLLDVSRIADGKLPLHPEPCDLAEIVREVVSSASVDADRQGSPIALVTPESVHGLWDRLRIEQVITNLIGNAVKYGRAKPIDVELEATDEIVTLRVRDRGIGIAPENVDRIFDRFERAVPAHHYGGFGLGLWIAKQIVDASKGTIRVQSAPDEGSTFIVTLPRSLA